MFYRDDLKFKAKSGSSILSDGIVNRSIESEPFKGFGIIPPFKGFKKESLPSFNDFSPLAFKDILDIAIEKNLERLMGYLENQDISDITNGKRGANYIKLIKEFLKFPSDSLEFIDHLKYKFPDMKDLFDEEGSIDDYVQKIEDYIMSLVFANDVYKNPFNGFEERIKNSDDDVKEKLKEEILKHFGAGRAAKALSSEDSFFKDLEKEFIEPLKREKFYKDLQPPEFSPGPPQLSSKAKDSLEQLGQNSPNDSWGIVDSLKGFLSNVSNSVGETLGNLGKGLKESLPNLQGYSHVPYVKAPQVLPNEEEETRQSNELNEKKQNIFNKFNKLQDSIGRPAEEPLFISEPETSPSQAVSDISDYIKIRKPPKEETALTLYKPRETTPFRNHQEHPETGLTFKKEEGEPIPSAPPSELQGSGEKSDSYIKLGYNSNQKNIPFSGATYSREMTWPYREIKNNSYIKQRLPNDTNQ